VEPAQELDFRISLACTRGQPSCSDWALLFDCGDDEWHALEKHCVCRKADLDNTKVVVERDINAALAAIHAQGFAFVDVHPGNILMSANGERAMLIDIESMSPLGVPVDNVMIRAQFAPKSLRVGGRCCPTAVTDNQSLKKVLAWLEKKCVD
jgi:hypothetical protein